MIKIIALGALLVGSAALAQPRVLIGQDTLLAYVDQLTQWQRDAAAIEPSAGSTREEVFRDGLRANAAKALQNGFVFLRSMTAAAAAAAPPDADPQSTHGKLQQRAAQIRQHIAALQSAAKTPTVRDELRLEHARLELVQTILANLNAASSKSPDKLSYTVESLARSLPELNANAPAPTKPEAPETPVRAGGTSILSISAEIFANTRKQRELDGAITATEQLKQQSMELMKALRGGLGEPPSSGGEDDAEAPRAAPMSIDERVAAYKTIGANIVPLAETMRWIDASKQTLREWTDVLQQQRAQALRQLAVYLGILVVTLAIALLLSELARRSLKRLRDEKRKRQLNTVRRILTGVAVLFILLFNFISDFSSFATFAGFMTAGLAVALQSVLLSLVAHFLFYGRYGVRNGDRVHVAGVTGDIVQIGMVRFYLRELEETKDGFHPTGKVVAFPNSILFQNVAFYKYA